MNNREFSTVITWDLATYKEFSKGALYTMKSRTVIDVCVIVYLITHILNMLITKNDYGFLSSVVTILLIWGLIKLLNRKGGIQYKRMLSNNNGQPQRNQLLISAGGIQANSLDNGNVTDLSFHRIQKIAETENLLILMMEYRQGFIIDKRTLTGGTSDELVEFLIFVCTNLKKRKVYSGRGTMIRKGVILFLLVAGFLFAMAQKIINHNEIISDIDYEEMYGVIDGKMNDLTFNEIAVELENLGIRDISKERLTELQNEWNQFSKEEHQYMDKVTMLLTEIGSGSYDDVTWEWSPSSSAVYAFDMEFMNVDSMYKEFLTGVSSIGAGDLDFTSIEENLDKVDWENGTGSRSVKFEWDGNNCYLGAEMMNDWFDFSFADNLNIMIAARSDEKQLYFGNDGYQMIYVFYCDSKWASEFGDVTGIVLSERLDY